MAKFVYLKRNNAKGKIGISTTVFETLAMQAVKEIKGANLARPKTATFSLKPIGPIHCTVHNDTDVEMNISLVLKKKDNIPLITESVQKNVAESLKFICDNVPLKVNIILEKVY